MNGARLITSDPELSAAVGELAARAGLHLSVHQQLDPTADPAAAVLTLAGVDQLSAFGEHLALLGQAIIVSAGTSSVPAHSSGGGSPVLQVPRDEQQLVPLFEDAAAPVLDRLRAAGYRIGFTDRSQRRVGYVTPLAVTDRRRHPGQAVYVNGGRFACGDAAPGLATVVQRSNFRSLHRRFPDVWTDTVARDVTELGAFVTDLPADAVDTLCSLTDPEVILDEADHRAVHDEDICASWADVAALDVSSPLRPAGAGRSGILPCPRWSLSCGKKSLRPPA
jgi:hypothetical protein